MATQSYNQPLIEALSRVNEGKVTLTEAEAQQIKAAVENADRNNQLYVQTMDEMAKVREGQKSLGDEKLKRLKELYARASVSDWYWEGLKIDPEDGHVYVPECSYLSGTNIVMSHDYEGDGDDCLLIQEVMTSLPALLQELEESRKDKARLDWMHKGTLFFSWWGGFKQVSITGYDGKFDGVRDAIDSAMGIPILPPAPETKGETTV